MKPVLIVQTGNAVPAVRARLGDFDQWFQRGMRLPPDRLRVVQVHEGESLPEISDVGAVVVSGSGHMVTERATWSEETAAWLREATARVLPVLGVCYGHQLLAHALGGTVEYNARGREMGTVSIEPLQAASTDPLLATSNAFTAHVTHLQTVTRLPAGAQVLARSALDDHQAVRYAERVWGVQFHPEFNVARMRGYIDARSDALRAEGIDGSGMRRAVAACAPAARVLRRFLRIAAKKHDP